MGKVDKNYQKKQYLSNRFLDDLKDFYGSFFNSLDRLRKSRSGVILIEFAFSVPVFLALIYYLHDLPKMKRWNRKVQFITYQTAQMIQTISQSRANKKITVQDIKNILHLAFLTVFPGVTKLGTSSGLPLGYWPHIWLYYVEGVSDTQACIKWELAVFCNSSSLNSDTTDKQHIRSMIRYTKNSNVSPESIYPKFSIKKGEVKIIVECALCYDRSYRFSNNAKCSDVSVGRAFGFLIASPTSRSINSGKTGFFNSIAIITPKAELFDTSVPK